MAKVSVATGLSPGEGKPEPNMSPAFKGVVGLLGFVASMQMDEIFNSPHLEARVQTITLVGIKGNPGEGKLGNWGRKP